MNSSPIVEQLARRIAQLEGTTCELKNKNNQLEQNLVRLHDYVNSLISGFASDFAAADDVKRRGATSGAAETPTYLSVAKLGATRPVTPSSTAAATSSTAAAATSAAARQCHRQVAVVANKSDQ